MFSVSESPILYELFSWIRVSLNGKWKGHGVAVAIHIGIYIRNSWHESGINFLWKCFWKFWYSLIDYENHLIQQFSWVQCSVVLGDGCQESLFKQHFPFCASWRYGCSQCVGTPRVLEKHLLMGWGRENRERRKGEKDREGQRGETEVEKDSWYFSHVGWLFCRAQLYLKPSSICSVPQCFHLV